MKCCEEVYRGNTRVIGVGAYSPCLRKATVERYGKWYCCQHDPIRVEERLIASVERSNIKRAFKRKMKARFG